MPTVKAYGAPKVETGLTPAPNLSTETMGAFNAPKPIDASGVTKLAADIWQEEREKADEVAINDATAKLTQAETEIMHGKNGLLNLEQADAMKAPDQLAPQWQAAVSNIEAGLTTDRQRMAFRRQVTERYGSMNRQLQEHIADESKKFDISKTESLVNNEQNAAIENYKDPARVALSISTQAQALAAFGRRHGLSDAKVEDMVSAALSTTHVGVINRMLANDEDVAADAYYKAHKDQIAGNQVAQVEKNLEEGSLRGNSQRVADGIIAKFGSNQSSADSAVRNISDPKLRDEVQQRVDYEFGKMRERKRNAEDFAFTSATNMIDAHPGADPRRVIPPALWNALSLEQRAALRRYSEAGAGGDGPTGVQSDKKWLDFLSLGQDGMAKLTRSELETNYLQYLGKRDRHSAITKWNAAKTGGGGDTKENPDLKSAFTIKQQIDDALTTSRLVTGDKSRKNDEARLTARVNRRVEDLRSQYAAAKGHPLTSQEEKAIVDQVILEEAFSATGKKTIDVKERGVTIAQVVKEEDGTTRVPYARVPVTERASIENAIRQNGGRVTRDKVERAYAAGVMGDASAAKRIIQEK